MKTATLLFFLVIGLTVATVELRRHHKQKAEKHHESKRHNHYLKSKYKTKIQKHGKEQEGSRKHHGGRIYKKYAMLAAPNVPLEEASPFQSQPEQVTQQQMVVPVEMNQGASPEMVSSYSNTPQPRAGQQTEESAPQQQLEAQPSNLQLQAAQDDPNQPPAPQISGGESSLATTEAAADAYPNAGLDPNTQGLLPQGMPKQDDMKNLDFYSGPLPGSKPKMTTRVGQQEQVKIVNLGEDEKVANTQPQVAPCGGCPPGAKCVNGQCQIREEDAKAQALAGKGSPTNPGTLNDIHSLEAQELKTLLKEASAADPATDPGSLTDAPKAGAPQATTQQTTSTLPAGLQDPTTAVDNQGIGQMQDMQSVGTELTASQPQKAVKQIQSEEPRFSHEQIQELRDFARMYKMYQFIRKMEQRLNDPDCAPICRTMCKSFCPAKCCRKHGKPTLSKSLMKTVSSFSMKKKHGKKYYKSPPHKVDATLDDDDYDEDDDEETEDEVNEKAGKKHVFVKIERNNELDKPRSKVIRKTS